MAKQRINERVRTNKTIDTCVRSRGSYRGTIFLGFVDFREGNETFGGLSGMLRQILSPSPEMGEPAGSICCNPSQNFSAFANQTLMLSTGSQNSFLPHQSLYCPEQSLPITTAAAVFAESHVCPICGLVFRSAMKLGYHSRTSHPSIDTQPAAYSCAFCSRTFLALGHLRMHEVTHANAASSSSSPSPTAAPLDKTFGCERCPASFRYRTLLERHRKMHDLGQEKPYSCPRCLMLFETRNLYNHHAKTCHRPTTTCNSELPVVPTSTSHHLSGTICPPNNLVHLSTPAPTATATAATTTTTATATTTTTVASYQCDSCTKRFATVESLNSHKSVHRSRPLVCDVCGKDFTHRKYYVVHQRIHTGERPYLCAMCGKSFTQASTLTVHRRYHTGERPYTCTLCGKGFVTRTIMLNHMKKH